MDGQLEQSLQCIEDLNIGSKDWNEIEFWRFDFGKKDDLNFKDWIVNQIEIGLLWIRKLKEQRFVLHLLCTKQLSNENKIL